MVGGWVAVWRLGGVGGGWWRSVTTTYHTAHPSTMTYSKPIRHPTCFRSPRQGPRPLTIALRHVLRHRCM